MLLDIVKKIYLGPLRLMARLIFWGTLVIVGAGVIFLLSFDLNHFKETIEQEGSAFLRREAKINGDIRFGVENFRPSIVLRSVEVAGGVAADALEIAIPFAKFEKGRPWEIFAALENVRLNGERLGDYEAPIRFGADGVDIPEIEGVLGGGAVKGSGSYLRGKLNVVLGVEGVRYADLSPDFSEGRADIEVLLEGAGTAPEDLIKSLNGHVRLKGGKGRMAGGAIDFWAGGLLTSMLSGGPKDETRINCAVADFSIKDGVARSRSILIDTDRVTVSGKGAVNFVKGKMDIVFSPAPKTASLVSLATPMRVSGPFGDVRSAPETKAVAKKIGGLLLSAVNPAAALLPMMEAGTGEKNPCAQYTDTK